MDKENISMNKEYQVRYKRKNILGKDVRGWVFKYSLLDAKQTMQQLKENKKYFDFEIIEYETIENIRKIELG